MKDRCLTAGEILSLIHIYWRDGILTAPSEGDFVRDISLMKEMGFNGCRKHQKAEDARFLYHADQMGFLVWGEMASACLYTDTGVCLLYTSRCV